MDAVVTDKKGRPASSIVSIVVAVLTLGYMLPWMIAALRGKQNAWGVFWINLLLGWTALGWIAALVLACMPHRVVGFRRS
ncbi:MAG: superinfection immunity protein [Nocardioides alkalitolerans]